VRLLSGGSFACAAIAAACVSRSAAAPQRFATSSGWVGCYEVRWGEPGAEIVDSLQLVMDAPRRVQRRPGFRTTFLSNTDSVIFFLNETFIGPAWHQSGDTLVVAEGILSGWSIRAFSTQTGFSGRLTTFTDCCSPPYEHHYPVLGARVACTRRAT